MASFSRSPRANRCAWASSTRRWSSSRIPNETFILGASTWRITDITHDRVLVTPAPGEPGKMPFWKGDGPGRPLEFGRRIGAMVRELRALPQAAALTRLVNEHDLDPGAAENLLRFLADQAEATGQVPDDRTIVVERCRDELGDWRVCVLTPFGSRIHIPWAMAVSARIRAAGGPEVETLWGDDGFVLRFPDTDEPPDSGLDSGGVGRGDAACAAAVGIDGAVCRAFSRGRGPRAAAAAPPRRSALAAVAVAQALLRSAQRGLALSAVSAAAGGLSRVPARCFRHACAG